MAIISLLPKNNKDKKKKDALLANQLAGQSGHSECFSSAGSTEVK